jgi:catechol 2,3-dioxygenase-like lactoylglutathione lyase family enzyme
VLGAVDHVGYLVRDLDAAVKEFRERFSLEVVRPVELPQFSISGLYLGQGNGSIEVFTITDEQLLSKRLGGHSVLLDHAAYEVADIDAVAAAMYEEGVRFTGPDRREEVREPFLLGDVRHLWTFPQTSCGQSLQLLER